MACGAPVIASRIPPIVETVGTAARLCEPTNVRELTAEIVALLSNPDARAELSTAGRKRAADFTWKRTAELTLAVYREALNESRRPARATA